MIQTKADLEQIRRQDWSRHGKHRTFNGRTPYEERNDRCRGCNRILISSASKERLLCGMCGRDNGETRHPTHRIPRMVPP